MKKKNCLGICLVAGLLISGICAVPTAASFENADEEALLQALENTNAEAGIEDEKEQETGEVADPEEAEGIGEEKPQDELETANQEIKEVTASGWIEEEGKYFYVKENGTRVTGVLTVEGAMYFMDLQTGERMEGWAEGGRYRYYAEPGTGKLVSGWQKIENAWYYFYPKSKAMAVGKRTIGGKQYMLDSQTGKRMEGWVKGSRYRYYAAAGTGELVSGWQKLDGSWYYFYPKSKSMAVGKRTIDGKVYLLNSQTGVMTIGWGQGKNNRYYADADGVLKSGWQKLGGSWYYFYPSSKAMATGLKKIGGTYYYLQPGNGAMATGWIQKGSDWYYFRSNGAMKTGWLQEGNTNYYLRRNGKMYQNERFTFNGLACKAGGSGGVTMESSAANYALKTLNQIGWNLQAAFHWSAGLAYYRPTPVPGAGVQHSGFYANYGFLNRKGNCYVMAATFYYMAKILNYDVHFVEGQVPLARGGMGPHGWTEIILNGSTYVFDPNFTNETGRNGYQIYYGMPGTWRYSSYRRVS